MHKIKFRLCVFLIMFVAFDGYACGGAPLFYEINSITRIKKEFKYHDVVALVYVTSVEKKENDRLFNTSFKILEPFKKIEGMGQEFETGWLATCCTCQMHFEEGKAYVIYALQPTESYQSWWVINAQGLSKEISSLSTKELKYLRKYSKK